MSETRNIRLMRALEGAAIRTIESETLTDRLTAIVGQTYLLLGYQTPDSRTLAILVAKIASDLVESYGFMTVEEVSYCFDLGAKGLLGDFAGMNMRTVTRWLKGYKHSDIRYQAIMALRAERARATLPPPSAAYKEEHERNFLRSVFRQYKEGYPLDRLFPSRVYRSLQERGVIHHSRAEKLYALSLFKNYRPTSRLYMPEEARQAIINSKAMAWLLKREFDAMTELRFDDEGVRMAA